MSNNPFQPDDTNNDQTTNNPFETSEHQNNLDSNLECNLDDAYNQKSLNGKCESSLFFLKRNSTLLEKDNVEKKESVFFKRAFPVYITFM